MAKRQKVRVQLEVQRVEDISPSLRRVVLSGEDFDTYAEQHGDDTDTYVKLIFQSDAGEVKRTYSVPFIDREAREIAIIFVTHADEGFAGPWACSAQPGDVLTFEGPGSGYRPDPTADHHLFVGDESAIPAILAALAVLSPDARATAFLEVDDRTHEIDLPTAAHVEVNWLHRDQMQPGETDALFDAVRSWEWPAGRVHAFVHGESALLKTVRPYLLDGRVARSDISVSAYWRRGVDEQGFRQWKSQQDEAVMRPEV